MPSQLLSPIARQLLLAIAAAVLAHAFATNGLQAQPHPVVGSFDPRFFPGSAPELTGAVFDLHGQLVVTGMFSEFERSLARGISVRRNGQGWQDVGADSNPATSPSAHFLTRDPEGIVYAHFDAGDDDVYIGRWNGERWTRYAPAPEYSLRSLVAGPGGVLYANAWEGSKWTTWGSGVLMWDEGQWTRLPEAPDVVGNLQRDETGGLYASWENVFRRWNPEEGTWTSVAEPDEDWIPYAFAIRNDGVIYAVTTRRDVGTASTARWSGTAWEELGDPPTDGFVLSIFLTEDGALYRVEGGGESGEQGVARWDGVRWVPLLEGIVASDYRFSIDAIVARDGEVVVAGAFVLPSGIRNLARFDGETWDSMVEPGLQILGEAHELVQLVSSPSGDVLALGNLHQVGATPVAELARWNGTAWENMDPPWPGAQTLAFNGDGTLFVGGHFGWHVDDHGLQHDDGPYTNLLTYRDGVWDRFPPFICEGPIDAPVSIRRLTFDFSEELLYAGGTCFHSSRSDATDVVGRWNGGSWEIIGWIPGRNASISLVIAALSASPDGFVYVGGNFDHADGIPASGIARWDGSRWSALDEGLYSPYTRFSGIARQIHTWRNQIVVAGDFERAGATAASNVATFEGDAWQDVSSPFYGGRVVSVITGPDGRLYGSGQGGSWDDSFVARYDGMRWERIAEGFQNPPRLAFDGDGGLLIDGKERWLSEEASGGIPGRPRLHSFEIFPNPATTSATLRLRPASTGRIRVHLYDTLGREIELFLDAELVESDLRLLEIDLSGLSSGAYFVRVTMPGGSIVKTLVRL